MLGRNTEIWLAATCLGLSLAAALIWVPLDTDTTPIYSFRRQTYIGDAMLPMIAAAGIAVCSGLHLVLCLRRATDGTRPPFDGYSGVFLLMFSAVVCVALGVMFWAGPLSVALFGPTGEEAVGYRQLRGSAPWKYIGFGLGGFLMVFGLCALCDGRFSLRRGLMAMLAVAGLILVFDVPFDTILLPPNGDF
ncbi:hypothetical protein [Microbulbifer sp. S227A]|uniref:hypothetical protein n=1 Tax=Microbulbifer sp. S227A TaxID=3415131 RepID=UPI003C7AB5E8